MRTPDSPSMCSKPLICWQRFDRVDFGSGPWILADPAGQRKILAKEKVTMKLVIRAISIALLVLCLCSLIGLLSAQLCPVTQPASVVVPGSLQSELGCPGDWQPDCQATGLEFDADDQVWQEIFDVPAGNWEYKVALNGSLDENYGANAQRNGANLPLNLPALTAVKFYYDHRTHWIADNKNKIIAVVPGSFQSELGCPGDWQPDCLRSWLQDPDGDGTYSFTATLPEGNYEAKIAINESWSENYGAAGVPNGPNISFTVPGPLDEMLFSYNSTTHVLTISVAPSPQPASVVVPGSLQSELGCPGDWQPDCQAAGLEFDADDQVWQETFDVPAGDWEYKVALNGSWDENYGSNAQPNGANLPLSLSASAAVKFYYDHKTHWIADNKSEVIAVVPGNFQSELGCSGDWQPDCFRSWLQDPDGDGTYSFTATLPGGNYEAKIAINESWSENYGAGGERDGANIPFTVPFPIGEMLFTYDPVSHVLSVASSCLEAQTITLLGVPASATYGEGPYALYAFSTSELPVALGVSGACALSGDSLALTGAGSCTVTATQPGNGRFAPALPVVQSFAIAKAGQTITWLPPAPIIYGTALSGSQLNASVTAPGASPVGALTYKPAAGTILPAGRQTLAVTAAATADYNSAAAEVTIDVNYASGGFRAPIKNLPSINTAKAGAIIPVKWQLFDASGSLISDLNSFVSLTAAPIGCDQAPADIAGEQIASPGSSTVVFDGMQFQFNWRTGPAKGCRVLKLSTADGQRYLAKFKFK